MAELRFSQLSVTLAYHFGFIKSIIIVAIKYQCYQTPFTRGNRFTYIEKNAVLTKHKRLELLTTI